LHPARSRFRPASRSTSRGVGSSRSAAATVEVYFFDKAPGSSFCTEVQWLTESGMTTGVAGGGFDPVGLVDRQAMAAFLYRLQHLA